MVKTMGFKNVHPYVLRENKTKCSCGKGYNIDEYVVTEESDYPPFDRGYTHIYTTCPNNCDLVVRQKG